MDIIDLAQKLTEGKTVKQTYNVFNSWNMNENDHTKMLLALLNYCDLSGQFPVLNSFLERFTKGRDKMIHYKHPQNVRIRFGKDYIDGLITYTVKDKNFAVIIENKIYNATDQKNQVRRYIKKVHEDYSIPINNIWVLYITGDGSKEISTSSYNISEEEGKTYIGNRFVALNYSEDILRWLNEDVIKPRIYPETLTSVARVYSEYLSENLFCSDSIDAEQEMLIKLVKLPHALDKFSADDIKRLYSLRKEVQEIRQKSDSMEDNSTSINNLYCVISSIIKRLERITFGELEQVSIEILNERWVNKLKSLKTSWKAGHRGVGSDKGYLQIRLVDEWDSVHVEWRGLGTRKIMHENKYTIVLHVESNPQLRQKYFSELTDKTANSEFKIQEKAICFNITAPKPLAKMEREELKSFLKDIYTKINPFFKVLIEKYKEYSNQ